MLLLKFKNPFKFIKLVTFLFLISFPFLTFSQATLVKDTNNVTIKCIAGCTGLTGTVTGTLDGVTYTVVEDRNALNDLIGTGLKGKFAINELPNLIKNALGDIYTKFIPFKVKEGQYMNFNFKIFNKIVEIFSPQLKLGSNTFAKGRVESNPKNFKLTFRSPNIKLEEFFANKIEVQLINDNPLFNSYIEIDSLATPYYKASKFSLINVTLNDTLYVKSEFKGGKKSTDEFDLNLYYTIDENNKSVVGFKKSNATFKNTPWLINASQNIQNKIVQPTTG